jgi:hypothetical protein
MIHFRGKKEPAVYPYTAGIAFLVPHPPLCGGDSMNDAPQGAFRKWNRSRFCYGLVKTPDAVTVFATVEMLSVAAAGFTKARTTPARITAAVKVKE